LEVESNNWNGEFLWFFWYHLKLMSFSKFFTQKYCNKRFVLSDSDDNITIKKFKHSRWITYLMFVIIPLLLKWIQCLVIVIKRPSRDERNLILKLRCSKSNSAKKEESYDQESFMFGP
jgi:hypothetical protein